MPSTNFERLIALAEEVFDAKNDTEQLDVNQEVLDRLQQLHQATVSEYDDGNGPVAWVLLIPTTFELMNRFLKSEISEKQLFDLTLPNQQYEAIYLCSALVLEEFRRKGITKRLALEAIAKIRKDHSINTLFVWSFSKEGELSAVSIANSTSLPLKSRIN